MSTWEQQISAWEAKTQKRLVTVHARAAFAVRDSVVSGSSETGAPGQPIDTGNLRGSWQLTHPEPMLARLTTNVSYAPAIEEGMNNSVTSGRSGGSIGSPMTLRSEVGGFHSVKLTRINFQKVVDKIVKEVARD